MWHPKNTYQVLFFQLYFKITNILNNKKYFEITNSKMYFKISILNNKKYAVVAISDFTIHLIISKWLRIQKRRQKRKTVSIICISTVFYFVIRDI